MKGKLGSGKTMSPKNRIFRECVNFIHVNSARVKEEIF